MVFVDVAAATLINWMMRLEGIDHFEMLHEMNDTIQPKGPFFPQCFSYHFDFVKPRYNNNPFITTHFAETESVVIYVIFRRSLVRLVI